ncbi:MAG: class I SAM-dependent methyltransferase [Candidatus Bathyarchaeota archaeon]|nr:class I SAM-dependent methyltransferase [Candidatus Bathyarchaeota archaeon]MDH5788177.1 class I SAM-dependent methyltransferase [Candidatus Bathyarchaeota archaeon]
MGKKEETLEVYASPFYYEVAFSFRDIKIEVDFFEQCIRNISRTRVKKIIDIGCGPSPYMFELVKRGYAFTGLDISKAMLNYSLEKARKAGIRIKTILADMRNFRSKEKFDFAFCMLGSIEVESNKDFLSHLDSVAGCLKGGGLYLIDASIQFDWTKLSPQNWTIIKNGLTINVTWEAVPISHVGQKIIERLLLEVIEGEKGKTLKMENVGKIIFPQEFLELVEKQGKFEFVGWYNNFDLTQPLEKAASFNRPTTLLRKK